MERNWHTTQYCRYGGRGLSLKSIPTKLNGSQGRTVWLWVCSPWNTLNHHWFRTGECVITDYHLLQLAQIYLSDWYLKDTPDEEGSMSKAIRLLSWSSNLHNCQGRQIAQSEYSKVTETEVANYQHLKTGTKRQGEHVWQGCCLPPFCARKTTSSNPQTV